ncbi:MAG: c-type cytochrome biogenesis protein CcmI [Hyphomicrobium sp.]|nr:c-type cytochrome biogenesis protein CcmI [Hyphomicrobium sp.]
MIFWIAVAALAAAVTYAVTRPLMQTHQPLADASEADLAVYRDQLAEIEADVARGVVTESEAGSAKAEVGRRVLRHSGGKSDSKAATDAAAPGSLLKPIYLATSLLLPLASVGLYLAFGAPGLPGQPLSERVAAKVDGTKPDDLIAKVEARLRDHPEDGKGWEVIAPVYMAQRRFSDAASAYASAIKVLGETPPRLQGFAEARIRAENGLVPDDARKALQTVLAADPKRKEPRIWLALAKEQDGKAADAASDYRALIAEAPEDAPWRAALQDRLNRIENPGAVAGNAQSAKPNDKGPTAANIAAAEAMSPDERQAMINRMVSNLAERLKANAKDKDGWLKLIRAYQMLGRKDDAVKAVADAKAGLAGDTAALQDIDDMVKTLGVGG